MQSTLKRTFALAGAIALVTPLAQAGEFNADCAGWTVKGNTSKNLDIQVVATLERLVDGGYVVWDVSMDYGVFTGEICLQNTWGVELPDGMYRANAVETVTNLNTGEVQVLNKPYRDFKCLNIEMRTPGYWKNHPEAWPELSLPIGGQTYSQDCLLELLNTPVKGDVRIILAKHLIAAKLNVLSGCPDSVASTITNADAYLDPYLTPEAPDCPNPFFSGSKPSGSHKQVGVGFKDILDAYNNNEL